MLRVLALDGARHPLLLSEPLGHNPCRKHTLGDVHRPVYILDADALRSVRKLEHILELEVDDGLANNLVAGAWGSTAP